MRRSLSAKVQKIITYAIILTILFDYFTKNVILLTFSLQIRCVKAQKIKKFHVNDYLILGDKQK